MLVQPTSSTLRESFGALPVLSLTAPPFFSWLQSHFSDVRWLSHSDVYDATLNWSSHFDFVKDCLEKYSKGSKTETATPTEATTAAEPAPTAQPTTAEALEEVPPAAAVQAPATL